MSSASPYQVDISDSQSAVQMSEVELLEVVAATLAAEGIVEAEISIALVDDPTIHEVNRTHLEHNYPTDVISFLFDSEMLNPRSAQAPGRRGNGLRIEGEVILSGDTAVREAREYGWEPRAEVLLYLVHGLLHLCGYDDLSDEEQILMRRREREILALFQLTPHYAEDHEPAQTDP
ncbi:MAG: rRNA maturation RNase YbeY [Planctomycetota bacterium]|nr:MAG: rRNA maturation RNase YbeY [Planctomycetota bacterium]